MKTLSILILAGSMVVAAGCGDDSTGVTCGAGTTAVSGKCVPDVTCGPGTVAVNGECQPTTDVTFHQIEQLARPGINEALLISDGFHSGYNATAPTFAGVPPDVLNQVVGEAKTVLKALYLGTCLINGIAGLSAVQGLHPAGMECHAVGAAVFEADGATQTAASIAAAQVYADTVFGLFIPDVMRVDTTVASSYLTPCGAGPQLLCGGRFLRDDTIDITYDFLLNGAATGQAAAPPIPAGLAGQVQALVSDGVAFDNSVAGVNKDNRIAGDPSNKQQGHPNVSNNFPYSANPL